MRSQKICNKFYYIPVHLMYVYVDTSKHWITFILIFLTLCNCLFICAVLIYWWIFLSSSALSFEIIIVASQTARRVTYAKHGVGKGPRGTLSPTYHAQSTSPFPWTYRKHFKIMLNVGSGWSDRCVPFSDQSNSHKIAIMTHQLNLDNRFPWKTNKTNNELNF